MLKLFCKVGGVIILVKDESLGLETEGTKSLGLASVSYKMLELVSYEMKIFETVSSWSRLIHLHFTPSRFGLVLTRMCSLQRK